MAYKKLEDNDDLLEGLSEEEAKMTRKKLKDDPSKDRKKIDDNFFLTHPEVFGDSSNEPQKFGENFFFTGSKLKDDHFILANQDNEDSEDDEENEDQSWVLDSLIGFLKSPLWSSSLNNFVDQMSVVFEADDIEDKDGNVLRRPEYESIFKQYRALVDQLISSHMADLGISEEQFASACEMAEGMLASKLKSVLFEELWAAENFDVFVRLMARRNIELQMEALDILAQRYGLVYDVFVPIGTTAQHFYSEDRVMKEAIVRSLDELKLDQEEREEESETIGEDLVDRSDKTRQALEQTEVKSLNEQTTSGDNQNSELQRDKARLEEIRQRVDKKMHEALQSAMAKGEEEEEVLESESEIIQVGEANLVPSTSTIVEEEKEVTKEEEKQIEEVSNVSREEEIKKRAEHLRQQRDRIIQMKQKERTEKISKYLIKEKEKMKNQPRPKTARRAEPGEDSAASSSATATESDSKDLAYRKTLAARLKAEVIFGGK